MAITALASYGGCPDCNILDRVAGRTVLGLWAPCHIIHPHRASHPVTRQDGAKLGCVDFRVCGGLCGVHITLCPPLTKRAWKSYLTSPLPHLQSASDLDVPGPRTQRGNWDQANKWDPLQLVVMFFCNKYSGETNGASIQGMNTGAASIQAGRKAGG